MADKSYQFGPVLTDRIISVVKRVDGSPYEVGLTRLETRFEDQPAYSSQLRIGTFTGSWHTGTWKTVTLTGTTQTAEVYNWCNTSIGADNDTCCKQTVIFGKAAGTNSVVEIPLQSTCVTCHINIGGLDLTTLPNYSGQTIQLLGHDSSACLRWYSVTSCSTTAS